MTIPANNRPQPLADLVLDAAVEIDLFLFGESNDFHRVNELFQYLDRALVQTRDSFDKQVFPWKNLEDANALFATYQVFSNMKEENRTDIILKHCEELIQNLEGYFKERDQEKLPKVRDYCNILFSMIQSRISSVEMFNSKALWQI